MLAAGVGLAGVGAYRTFFDPSSQVFGPFPDRAAVAGRVVALTFDDGPNEPYTSRLVDLLADRGVVATFFQVGACVQRYPRLSSRMVQQGHVLGNHSHTHRFTRYATEPSLRTEIARAQIALEAEIGRTPALFRPPWLCHQPPLLAEVRRQGLQVVSGTFAHPLEVVQVPAPWIARHAVAVARPGAILIFHDGFDARGGRRDQTVEAVRLTVDELTDRGYTFMTVDQMLGVPAYQD